MLTTELLSRIFNGFNNKTILIIGDVMVDAYLWGHVERISPEAPVPIVSVEKRENRLGGAANVGLNISSLGAAAIICSVIGNDVKGNEFLALLDEEGLNCEGIIQSSKRVTTTKFRVIGNNTQMLRVDEEITSDLEKEEMILLRERITDIFRKKNIDAVIFQDYDKGTINGQLISSVVEMASSKNIPVIVDPKKKNFLSYKNVTLFKPNLKEIKEGLNISFDANNIDEVKTAVAKLQALLKAEMVLNTLSENGVFIQWAKGSEIIPAHYRTIVDVSGAGDTVISVAALCLASEMEAPDLAALANLAGGIVCEEVGVVPINKTKFQDEAIRLLA
ncbi:MAG: bifunctional ADP-heptose synthase [Bacteroidales bacterium]|nr:bifunctional ADP-heptose synthase [Bacteroidales bacterium]